ncbi:MAG: hypothetical protein K8U03_22880 [Planctomycetia bacterium]|nr:hypothetical protein [Planctomycetia bacterium]
MVRSRSLARIALLVVGIASLATLGGCATYADRLTEVRDAFGTGNIAATEETLEVGMKRRCDRNVLTLDRAVVQLSAGQAKEAEQGLRAMRDKFDHLEKPAVGEKALSMLTDAQSEAYAGEDYEKVLIRVFLCLANLMTDGQDVGAYAYQVAEKQQQLIHAATESDGTNPKANYHRVAFGAYLNGAIREQTHADFDDVERSCAVVCSWEPEFPYAQQDLERARYGKHSQPGNGVLYVITLVGVGPYKEEVYEEASTISLLIADRILSVLGNQTLPPTIAPVKVPRVVLTPHEVGAIDVRVNGFQVGRTATITDIGRMAVEQHEAVYDRIVAEAVVRRIVKKGVVYGTKEALGIEKNSLPGFALDVVGVAWEASESADTRCWGLLPDKIQVLRVELPAGTHDITLQSQMTSGLPLGRPSNAQVEIADGRNSFMLANFPLGNLAGTISTSKQ